uniref:Splicing factor SF3a60 /Prp9 subunit C-terminal domain-containing protein n=1 Tax=Helianthus annuus TaxID=4232 RepID=A0A251TVE0_HELAN
MENLYLIGSINFMASVRSLSARYVETIVTGGRRAYERHFKEFRHQYGMRRLGIPNTKISMKFTSIEEAQQLWERIKEKQG